MSDTVSLPAHVGIILDGNRRWAAENGLPTLEGHRQGAEVFKDIALTAFDSGVKYLSAFVFSTENWQRTEEEVGYLMKLVVKATEKYLDTFHQRGIKVILLGRKDGLEESVLKSIERTEDKTKDNQQGVLALCFNYGGQQEIVDAVRQIVSTGTDPGSITPESISGALYHPEVPQVDLLIRTSGEQRTSGFMLYRAAYAELCFTDKLWPDFTREDFNKALDEYTERERRFGT